MECKINNVVKYGMAYLGKWAVTTLEPKRLFLGYKWNAIRRFINTE